ncbi:hypothetical protein Cob_v000874 [Colletotrichum orbiculare MAFF 240422]|uniref:Uncharacterized protein n=1 Tax=Colletotrichum orbiculare (strain 104-T / ATCC 96160 / CBS 514.97 / LARS 414 / MAFF 240422) TaxID=1213857 RepID=A0A484G6U9_COLOR|nr:hypothetical protein Cob_v000874 [Colletotrichum orbiculare MAFF 240422]
MRDAAPRPLPLIGRRFATPPQARPRGGQVHSKPKAFSGGILRQPLLSRYYITSIFESAAASATSPAGILRIIDQPAEAHECDDPGLSAAAHMATPNHWKHIMLDCQSVHLPVPSAYADRLEAILLNRVFCHNHQRSTTSEPSMLSKLRRWPPLSHQPVSASCPQCCPQCCK